MKDKSKQAKFFCESCGAEVKASAKFCDNCGKFFASVRCPNCGKTGSTREFEKGCPDCGYAVGRSGINYGVAGKRNSVKRNKSSGKQTCFPLFFY